MEEERGENKVGAAPAAPFSFRLDRVKAVRAAAKSLKIRAQNYKMKRRRNAGGPAAASGSGPRWLKKDGGAAGG